MFTQHTCTLTSSSSLDLKQDLLSRLSKAALLNIKGVTDTEHLFALVLSQLKNPDALSFTLEELSGALIGAYQILMGLLSKHGILGGFTTLNCSLTDGVNCVVTRFCDKPGIASCCMLIVKALA